MNILNILDSKCLSKLPSKIMGDLTLLSELGISLTSKQETHLSFDDKTILVINPNIISMNDVELVELITHEAYHYKQILESRLKKYKDSFVIWEDQIIKHVNSKEDFHIYFNSPWEVEAYNYSWNKMREFGFITKTNNEIRSGIISKI